MEGRKARSSTSAASTARSSCAATASSWRRSRGCSRSTRRSPRRPWGSTSGAPASARWSPGGRRGRGRGFLKARLPEPAVPSLFARLPVLPRNASGKLDRRALPIPKLEATSAGGYEAPATPAEEAVAYVWRDVLGVPRVGRKDDFFALGGR